MVLEIYVSKAVLNGRYLSHLSAARATWSAAPPAPATPWPPNPFPDQNTPALVLPPPVGLLAVSCGCSVLEGLVPVLPDCCDAGGPPDASQSQMLSGWGWLVLCVNEQAFFPQRSLRHESWHGALGVPQVSTPARTSACAADPSSDLRFLRAPKPLPPPPPPT